ncbi:MAG: TRAM domain-containing protein [Nanoarchaeota archaeon]
MTSDMYDERPRRFDRGNSGFRSNGGGGGGGFGGPRRSFAPVKEGEELDVTIEAIAAKGDGIAKRQGFVIFVPSTKVGDQVKIRITKVLQKVAFSEIIGRGAPKQDAAADAPTEESSEEQTEEPSTEDSSSEDSENFGEDNQ